MNISQATALIAEIDPNMANLFADRPFHRRAIVTAMFESMKKSNLAFMAYRFRVVLHRFLDEAERQAAVEEAAQL